MGKTTSFVLGEHFERLINQQVGSGRYASASEVVRDALRVFEEQQTAIKRLNDAVEEGYDLILYKDVVFVSDKVNITQQIIEKIEKQ